MLRTDLLQNDSMEIGFIKSKMVFESANVGLLTQRQKKLSQ